MPEVFNCPHCGQEWKKTQIRRELTIPVVTSYEYEGLRLKKSKCEVFSFRRSRRISKIERDLITRAESTRLSSWIPTTRFDKAGPQYRRNALSARYIDFVTDLFFKRNLHVLGAIWQTLGLVKENRVRQCLEFAFTAILSRASRLNRLRPSGAGDPQSGTIYISSLTREDNVLRQFEERVRVIAKLFKGKNQLNVVIRNGSACSLPEIPDCSIDYIFTDPPFGSNIYYSEPNLIWESWLGKITDVAEEAVVHRKNDGGTKRLDDYARLMNLAFMEMYRVLKPGRWATVEFNNSDGKVFDAIKQAIRSAEFEIVSMQLFDKVQKTFKQIKGEKGEEDVVDKDIVFNLRKPAAAKTEAPVGLLDIEHQIADLVGEHLKLLPDRIKADPAKYSEDHRTTATINSVLMNTLIPRGVSVDRLNLPFIERVCHRYFRKVGNRWYLRGEAIGIQNGSGVLIEEEVAIKDEVSAIEWIRQRLKSGPLLVGELKPLWMRATGLLPAEVSQQLNLDDLLAENFWRDANTNRWREPTEDERERMNDDRSIRVLHDAERFVANTLRRKTTDAELCEWIDVLFQVCKQAADLDEGASLPLAALRGFDPGQGYRLISQLFQSVLREMVTAVDYGRAEKQARVAAQRLSKASQESTPSAEGKCVPGQKQMTLDWTDE